MHISLHFLLLFATFPSVFPLDCTNKSNFFDTSKTFSLSLTDKESDPKSCIYRVSNISGFTVPTFHLTKIGLTGSNLITIHQNTTFAGQQSPLILNSTNYGTIDLQLLPAFFDIEFKITDNTINDFFHLEVSFSVVTPTFAYFNVSQEGLLSVIDSDSLVPNVIYQTINTNFVQIVTFSDAIDQEALKKVMVFRSGGKEVLGTIYDIWKNEELGKSLANCLLLNLNPLVIDSFSMVIGFQEFSESMSPGYTSKVQKYTSGVESFNSIGTEQIIFDIRKKGDPMPTNYNNIKVNGTGWVWIDAGCTANPVRHDNYAALINQNTTAAFEDLSVYGRCITYTLYDVNVTWTKNEFIPSDTPPTRNNQQGVIMSKNYPYKEFTDAYTVTRTFNVPDSDKKLSVTYSKDGDAASATSDGNSVWLGWRQTVTSQSSQKVECSAYNQGCMIRFTINSAMSQGALLIICLLSVLSLIRFQ